MLEVTLTPSQFEELKKRLKDVRPALSSIGKEMVRRSRIAFYQQKLGPDVWPKPWGGFLNVAGAVHDLSSSSSIEPWNLKARPALLASGKLFRSVNESALSFTSDSVKLQPDVPYAAIHQFGGVSHQPITPAVKANLKAWLKSNPKDRKQLGWLFNKNELVTKVHKRPFLGIDGEMEKKIVSIVEHHVAKGP